MEENPPSLEEIYERCGERKTTGEKKKTNLNKKKGKRRRGAEIPNAIKNLTMARVKKFSLYKRAPRRNPVGGRGGGAGRQKQKRKKAYEEGRLGGEDRGGSGKEGLKLLADISSGEQAR